MGIFDIFKRNKENKQEEPIREQPAKAEAESSANEVRRFTLLVEDTFQLKDAGVVVAGTVRGTIQKDDAIYILHPGSTVTLATVNGLETKIGDEMKQLTTATDISVGVLISDVKDKSEIQKYSLLTNIRPQPSIDVTTSVENPYVLGMSCEYGRFQKEAEYLNLLIYEIVRAHYLVPVFLDKEPESDGSGKAVFTENTTMSFPSLPHPEHDGEHVFPVFTDWNELNKWTGLFNEERPAKTMIFRFPDCSAFATKEHSGMVINPYSESPIFLPAAMIENIRNSSGYQDEFVKEKKPQVEKVNVEKNTRIMLGVPKEVNEVRLIREALAGYGKQNPDVDAIYLLLKVDEDNNRAYFCVTDSAKELPGEVYAEMYQEAKPFAQEVRLFEFAGRKDIKELSNSLTEEALIYKKQ